MRVSDDRYDQDIRKHNLASRMISLGARNHTIVRWTGLSQYRVQALAKRYHEALTNDHSRRGISPFQTAFFGQSPTLELESLILAFVCLELKVLSVDTIPDARAVLPELTRGERLLSAYRWYRRLIPNAQISLERTILLLIEFAEGRSSLCLRRCKSCPGIMLVDLAGIAHSQCPYCRSPRTATGA